MTNGQHYTAVTPLRQGISSNLDDRYTINSIQNPKGGNTSHT